MFCPKCGEELVRKSGELTCVEGQMDITQDIETILTERFADHKPSPERGQAPTIIQVYPHPLKREGSKLIRLHPWYCPGCGVVLDEKLACPECHVSIRDLQGPLLERHPHVREEGVW